MKRSSWSLRSAKSDYFGTSSLSFTRVSYLSDKTLGKIKSNILRDFSDSSIKEKNNYINFKYKFPSNTAESQLGYKYFTLFPSLAGVVTVNGDSHVMKIGKTQVSNVKKILTRLSNSDNSINPSNLFFFKKIKKQKELNNVLVTSNINSRKLYNFGKSKMSVEVNKTILRRVKFPNKFSFKSSLGNKIFGFYSNRVLGQEYLNIKKKVFKLNSRITLMFYYKSKPVLSKFLLNASTKYFNFRFMLNRVRLDHLVTSILLNSIMSIYSLGLVSDLAKNKMASVKQTLAFKLFKKIEKIDAVYTNNISKIRNIKKKKDFELIIGQILNSKLSKKKITPLLVSSLISKIAKISNNNKISSKFGYIFFKKIKNTNLESVFDIKTLKKRIKFVNKKKVTNNNTKVVFGSLAKNNRKSRWFSKKDSQPVEEQSLVEEMTSVTSVRNLAILKKLFPGKRLVTVQERLKLNMLPPTRTYDALGEVVGVYDRVRLLSSIRKNTKKYSRSYSYKLLNSRLLIGSGAVSHFSDFGRFGSGSKGLRLVRWYSLLLTDRRRSYVGGKNFFFRKNSIDCLFSKNISKLLGVVGINNTTVFSKKSSRFLSFARTSSKKDLFIRLKSDKKFKKELSHIKKLKFNFRRRKSRTSLRIANKRLLVRKNIIKHYFKENLSGSYRLPKSGKITTPQARARRFKAILLRVARYRRRSSTIRNLYLFKKFLYKPTNFRSNFYLNSFRSLGFFKKNKFLKISILRSNLSGFYNHFNFFSKKKKKLKSSMRRGIRLRKKYKSFLTSYKISRKRTRLLIYMSKRRRFYRRSFRVIKKNNIRYFKNKRLFLKTELGSKNLKKNIYKYSELENKKNTFSGEFGRFYFNFGSQYSVNKNWNYSTYIKDYDHLLPRYQCENTSRFFRGSYYRQGFLFSGFLYKRLAFKASKFNKKVSFYPVRVSLMSKLKKNSKSYNFFSRIFKNNNVSDSSADYLLTLLKFKKPYHDNCFIKFFFNKMNLSNSVTSSLGSFLSSKFLLNSNSVNFFNLRGINSLVTKNMKIFDNVDYFKIFKNIENTVSKKLLKFEKKNVIRRRVNNSYSPLFFFFSQNETYLYRKYLLTYKKHLRKFGKKSKNIIIKKRIRFYNS